MNLGDSLNMMTGLTSSSYSSILGNSLNQNILGTQTTNSFGMKSDVFVDGIRLLEKLIYDTRFEFTPTSESKKLEKFQTYASLGGLWMLTGVMKRQKDDKGRQVWAGLTRMNVGDVAELNYMGDNLKVYRAVNQLTYHDPIATKTEVKKQQAYIEDFKLMQDRLLTFYWVLWVAALITNLVFVQYSVTIAVDQSLADNKEWQIANMAMEIAQIIALLWLGWYESTFLVGLATEERASAYIQSNNVFLESYDTKIDDLEQRMVIQLESVRSSLNVFQGTSKTDNTSFIDTVKNKEEEILEKSKKQLEKYKDDLIAMKEHFNEQIKFYEENPDKARIVKEFREELVYLDDLTKKNDKRIKETTNRLDHIKQLDSTGYLGSLVTKVANLENSVSIVTEQVATAINVIGDTSARLENAERYIDEKIKKKKSSFKNKFVSWFRENT